MIEEIKRLEGEADFEYGLRLLTGKVEGLYDIDWQDVVDELGLNVHRDTLRKNFNKTEYCQEYGYSGYDVLQYYKDKQTANDSNIRYKDNISLSSDGTQTSDKLIRLSEEELKDVGFILKCHGYDPKEWELINAKNSMWNASKQEGIKTLYSSKISVKPRVDTISLEEIQEHFETFTNNYTPRKVEDFVVNTSSGKMLEIPIMDLHLGKLSWNLETGENYDYKIAEERFFHAIDDIVQKTKCYQFEKIIFPIGNDFVNFDNIDGNTTGGTKQDNDLRWQKVYLKAMEILVKAIESLSTIAPVEVFYIGGNHDKTTSFYLTCYLHGFFHNKNNKVTVDLSPNIRKYIEFGRVLIGYTHGNLEKKRIGGIMQVEAREAWGRTIFHEFHLGHLHSEQTKEENGIIIRNISSITSGDAWHHESGYVGAIRKAQAFIWDKEYGLEGIINSVIV